MQLSVAARNASLDAIETAVGGSPTLEMRTGVPPADCAAADTGTVLATMTLPADWMAAASGGSKALSGTWQDTAADAGGEAAHYRIKAGATCHIQGLLSGPWVASTAVVVGAHRHNGGNVYRCTTAGTTAGSGGPTGTGTGITDGTAVWSYVGPVAITLDNANIAVGQQVSVTGFTITAGGA